MSEIQELVVSRPVSYDELRSEVEVRWIIWAVNDELEAITLLRSTAPLTWMDPTAGITLNRAATRVDPLPAGLTGGLTFLGFATYRSKKRANQPYCVTEFDTTGGTKHQNHSIRAISNSQKAGQAKRWMNGAIEVSPDGVQGVDLIAPDYVHTKQCQVDKTAVTNAFVKTVFDLTGTVDSNADFPDNSEFHAGEALFLGGRGTEEEEHWSLTFSWKMSPNAETLKIAEGTGWEIGIGAPSNPVDGLGPAELRPDVPVPYQNWAKLGWEYLWIWYDDVKAEDADGLLVKKPTQVYVEQVYEYKDHNALLGLLP